MRAPHAGRERDQLARVGAGCGRVRALGRAVAATTATRGHQPRPAVDPVEQPSPPARLHLALKAEGRQRARGAQQQRGPAPDRLADEDAAGRERSRRISVGREVAAVHRRHRAQPARQRARPGPLPHRFAGRRDEHSHIRVDPEHVHPPRPALASNPRPANPRRQLGARAPLVERPRAQRQFGRGARGSRRERHREREKRGGAEDHAPVRVAADPAEDSQPFRAFSIAACSSRALYAPSRRAAILPCLSIAKAQGSLGRRQAAT